MKTQTIKRTWDERGDLLVRRRDQRDVEPGTPVAFVVIERDDEIGTIREIVGAYGQIEYEARVGDVVASGKSVRAAVLTATGRADFNASRSVE
jgi:hypothetical protein